MYRSILAMAPRTSSTRSRHSLGGNNRLMKDSVAELRPQGRRRHEIDLVANELAELALQADELKEPNRAAELNEQIDIAILAPFIAGEGAEKRQTRNAKRIQQRPAVPQYRQDVVASECSLRGHRDHSSAARQLPLRSPFNNLRDFFVDTMWTNAAHDYAETRVNTRSSTSDLLPRIARSIT